MAKMVGLNLIIKREWIEKTISLLDEVLSDADYRKELDDYLAYEIESPTNRRKAREILMRVWVRNAEGAEKLQQDTEAAYKILKVTDVNGNDMIYDRIDTSVISHLWDK